MEVRKKDQKNQGTFHMIYDLHRYLPSLQTSLLYDYLATITTHIWLLGVARSPHGIAREGVFKIPSSLDIDGLSRLRPVRRARLGGLEDNTDKTRGRDPCKGS
jgi:hypothetical protein